MVQRVRDLQQKDIYGIDFCFSGQKSKMTIEGKIINDRTTETDLGSCIGIFPTPAVHLLGHRWNNRFLLTILPSYHRNWRDAP